MMKNTVEEISLQDIYLDRDTQIRAAVSEETIQRYYEVMADREGRDKFPPILLFRDEEGNYWLADGHHRVMAAIRRKFTSILAIVRSGTKSDAIWEAAKANGRNGLPLGRSDLRRAVEMILVALPERSTTCIAETLGCSQSLVANIRSQLTTNGKLTLPEKTVGKDGRKRSASRKKKAKTATAKSTVPEPETPPRVENVAEKRNETAVTNVAMTPETIVEKVEQSRSDEDRSAEADALRTRIHTTISLLVAQLEEWFAIAPDDQHKDFDADVGARLRSVYQ